MRGNARGRADLGQEGVSSMSKQNRVTRTVAQHRWADVSDWASALDELADLTDEQIDQVAERARPRNTPCEPSSP